MAGQLGAEQKRGREEVSRTRDEYPLREVKVQLDKTGGVAFGGTPTRPRRWVAEDRLIACVSRVETLESGCHTIRRSRPASMTTVASSIVRLVSAILVAKITW